MATHVETYHYDNARTGWNKREKHLTPAKVGSPKFGLLFEQSVDDMVFAQPLYVEGLRIKKHKRNVVFVGTEAGTIYAFDADKPNGGNPLWTRSLVNAAAGETGPGVTLGVLERQIQQSVLSLARDCFDGRQRCGDAGSAGSKYHPASSGYRRAIKHHRNDLLRPCSAFQPRGVTSG